MMYTITRSYAFSAAHRIEGHPKCGRLHGHNYEVIVECAHPTIPSDGMLIDYSKLDELVKPIVDEMDHRYIMSGDNRAAGDPYADIAAKRGDIFELSMSASTAEFLAAFLWSKIIYALRLANYSIYQRNLRVTVKETPKSSATYAEE